jgi:hypothetical protein
MCYDQGSGSDGTLRSEHVDEGIQTIAKAFADTLNAEIRT